MMNQIWDGPFYIMAKAKAKETEKPKPPSPRSRLAARLVSIGQGEAPSPSSDYVRKRNERFEKKWPATPDAESVAIEISARLGPIEIAEPDLPNLGPNTPEHTPQRFGLLDFQDIALFLWPPYRQRRRPFNTNEQCLILKYRNAKLSDLTQVELVEVQAWMEQSEMITVEEKEVNMRHWRVDLDEEDLKSLVRRMEEDLKRAQSISMYTKPRPSETSGKEKLVQLASPRETSSKEKPVERVTPPATYTKEKPVEMATPPKTPPQGKLVEMNRSQRLAAKRRIEDDSE